MTNEEKDLLLKDLCARLPYGVKSTVVKLDDNDGSEYYTGCEILGIRRNQLVEFIRLQDDKEIGRSEWYDISWFRPYLRPMSSITKEEMENLEKYIGKKYDFRFTETESFIYINWLNSHHFDYRGLIEKGLALQAPEGMYN